MMRKALADAMAARAQAFLQTLDGRQRSLASWPFLENKDEGGGDLNERRRWFYTPTDHGGLALADMTPRQERLAFRLVASGLSRAGYYTVATIIGLDNVLDEVEGWTVDWGRERGRDPRLYYVRIFGDPISGGTWSWRFGGHHVSINHTIVNGEVVAVTPCFLGADPASSPLLGPHPLRPLAGVEDYGRELVCSLTIPQRKIAIVSPVAPIDLVGGNRSTLRHGDKPPPLAQIWRAPFDPESDEGRRIEAIERTLEAKVGVEPAHLEAVRFSAEPKGISANSFSPGQRALLRRLLDTYLQRMPETFASEEGTKYDGVGLERLSFMWAGSLEPGVAHYYRIQGPRLVIEYDNAARDANHVHAVWRDPEGDFGADILADHYREAH
jgi:Protein of unknown function (DUF3500)